MKNKLKISGVFAVIFGSILVLGGLWAIIFTYNNVAKENITTPEDATIPSKKVLGPLTLKAQSDVIRNHTLKMTDGKTYAEMPRQVAKLDQDGNTVLDEQGNVIMIDNAKRGIWVTATSLMTALHLAILSYAFSIFTILFGIISIWTGLIFYQMSKDVKIISDQINVI